MIYWIYSNIMKQLTSWSFCAFQCTFTSVHFLSCQNVPEIAIEQILVNMKSRWKKRIKPITRTIEINGRDRVLGT